MTTNRHYIRRKRALALGLVALFGLAFVRSLFPGMCATQVAIVSGEVSISSSNCCTRASLSVRDHPETDAPSRSQVPRCAFCLLALAPCTTSPYAEDGRVSQHFTLLPAPEPAPFKTCKVLDTNVGRDPPPDVLS